MRVAIPVDENKIETTVCMSFGRTPYFMVYETDDKEIVFLDNSAASSQGGAGIKAAQMLVDESIAVLLTPRCGQNAADVLIAAGIQILKTTSNNIQETLKSFDEGLLLPLNEIHSGFHQHGSK